jgi:multidrug efflux pump subunit AcrB
VLAIGLVVDDAIVVLENASGASSRRTAADRGACAARARSASR